MRFFCFIADYVCSGNRLTCPDDTCGKEDGKLCNARRDCPRGKDEEDCECMKLYSFFVSLGPFSSEQLNVKFLMYQQILITLSNN